jgi:hypothetical protein
LMIMVMIVSDASVQRVAIFFATICNYFLFGPVVPQFPIDWDHF